MLHALTRTFLFDTPRVSLHTLHAFAVLSRYSANAQWMVDPLSTTASASASASASDSKQPIKPAPSQAQGQGLSFQRYQKMSELLKLFSGKCL